MMRSGSHSNEDDSGRSPVCSYFMGDSTSLVKYSLTDIQGKLHSSRRKIRDPRDPNFPHSATHIHENKGHFEHQHEHLKSYMPIAWRVIRRIEQNGGEARVVGGTVRDAILKERSCCYDGSGDYDVASSFEPQKNIQVLTNIADCIIPTGIKYGTITVVIGSCRVEVTSLRKDVRCYGRSADIAYHASWYDDALRRDFTINAMSMDKYCIVYDYFSGVQDLKHGIVRFTGDPKMRIEEDYLRILRYLRFRAYLNSNCVHEPSEKYVSELLPRVSMLSGERIKNEMWKILAIPGSLKILKGIGVSLFLQHACGGSYNDKVCDNSVVEPCFNALLHESDTGLTEIAFMGNEPIVNLASLFLSHNVDANTVHYVIKRWRLSNREAKLIQTLCFPNINFPNVPKKYFNITINPSASTYNELSHKQLMFYVGYDVYAHYIKLLNVMGKRRYENSVLYLLQCAHSFLATIPQFPVNGYDLLPIVDKRSNLNHYINKLKEVWVESGFCLTKTELLAMCLETLHN